MGLRWLVELKSYATWLTTLKVISCENSILREASSGSWPPAAPHQNECPEALVKSCKGSLKRAIGKQVLTLFKLYTCLLEVANLLNQRPIGHVPNDPDDTAYLCPSDILLGRASPEVPQRPFNDTKNPWHWFKLVQRIVQSFWRSWKRDVLPVLVPRKKWQERKRNVQVDDMVIVADNNAIQGKWTPG